MLLPAAQMDIWRVIFCRMATLVVVRFLILFIRERIWEESLFFISLPTGNPTIGSLRLAEPVILLQRGIGVKPIPFYRQNDTNQCSNMIKRHDFLPCRFIILDISAKRIVSFFLALLRFSEGFLIKSNCLLDNLHGVLWAQHFIYHRIFIF